VRCSSCSGPGRWPCGDHEELLDEQESIHGVQYLAIRYTERLAEAEAVNSVGSRGDSDDNALAETVNGLYKAELIHRHGPWRSVAQVELATAEWVDFWDTRRLHEACVYLPPAEFEAAHHLGLGATAEAA
jgi:putative transposase